MNTNCNRLDLHQETTTKNSRTHSCAHECLAAVEPRPTPRAGASKEQKPADNDGGTREKNLERAIVIGAVLIFALAAVGFYMKFAPLGDATGDYSNSGIKTTTHH
jgi:hypothetical protein